MTASPKNSDAPNIPIPRAQPPLFRKVERASAINDKIPPSPLLSARKTKTTYLIVTMSNNAQNISEITP